MIRLGGPVFERIDDPRELARLHRRLGFTAAYAPRVDLKDTARMAAVRDAFAAEDVILAEVGAWCNLLAVEPERRKANLQRVVNGLALADELGARCCVDYLGTLAPDSDYGPDPANLTPDAFDLGVETVRAVIDAVKPRRARFCLEMMQWILPDSVDAYLDLLRAVDRPAFGVHLDPVNLVTSPRIYFGTGSLIRDCFERLGQWVASCHAKDIVLRGQLAMHFDEVRPGLGNLDYRVYVVELARLPNPPPLMLEHLPSQEEYTQAFRFIRSVEQSVGA
jgi:sugar phosphate isomerase/epimerase